MKEYVTIPERDLGAGIDSQSAPNQVPPGFVEDARDADPIPTGSITKRRGYQGYAGEIPLRIKGVKAVGTSLSFLLDDAIDLSTIRSTPIIVTGRTHISTGDFGPIDSTHYYSSFQADARYVFDTASTPIVIPATTHLLSTPFIWAGIGLSMSQVNASNEEVFASTISVDKVTFDVTITYVNSTGADFAGFIYLADRSPSASTYVGNTTTSLGTETLTSGTHSFSIPFSTHALASSQLLVKVFQDTGTAYQEILPSTVAFTPTTGLVTVTLINGDVASKTIFFALSIAPTENFVAGAVLSGTTNSITVDLSTFASPSFFLFLQCFVDDGVNPIQLVLPNSVAIDAVANTATIQFIDSGSGGANFTIYWQFVELTIKTITVTQSTPATAATSLVQLTLWGLLQAEVYSINDSASRPGWTTHIDSYRSPGISRLVAGLGGNLFSAQTQSEQPSFLPTLYPRLQGILSTDFVIGPVFWDTGELPARTRGYITGDTGGTNTVDVSSVQWDSGTGWVKYVLSIPSMVIVGTLSTIIDTSSFPDRLRVDNTSYAIHNGEFQIKQVTAGINSLTVWVKNELVVDSDFDVTGAGGVAGISTDRLSLVSSSPFLIGDGLTSPIIPTSLSLTCIKSVGVVLIINGVSELLALPAGLRLAGTRSSDVLPWRTSGNSPSVVDIVRGDMITYVDFDRELRVLNVNAMADVGVTIAAGNGQEADVTVNSGNINSLWVGEKIILQGGASYEGTYTITSINTSTSFTILSDIITADTATLIGQTVYVDEVIPWADSIVNSNFFTVPRRWFPIETPDDVFDLTPDTYIHQLNAHSFTDQPILRSTMVKDSLYLTNGDDEVFKYDGSNIYRAGLFRWQPHLFLTVDTGSVTPIVVNNPSIVTAGHAENKITLSAEVDKSVFQIGDRIFYTLDGNFYTIRDIQDIASTSYIYLDRKITAVTAASTLKGISTFQYYLRMNAIDANNNVVASAVTGSADMVAELTGNSAVRIRAQGMPAWGAYDYDRLEVQIFRSKANAAGVFYHLITLSQSFNTTDGYLDFIDATPDASLTVIDPISILLNGVTVPTALDQPLRAKRITNAGNRLVLGNIQDYPILDIQILKGIAQLLPTNFIGQSWLFRLDNTDTGTVTDMTNRVTFEFRDATSPSFTVTAGSSSVSSSSFLIQTSGAHGAVAGNWIYLYRSSASTTGNLRLAGWWQIATVPAANQFTVSAVLADQTAAVSATADSNAVLFATVKSNIPVGLGTDYNYGMANGNPDQTIFSYEFTAMRRLANAINTSQRRTTSAPWMIADAGNEFSAGQLLVRQPKVLSTTMEVVVPAYTPTTMNIFVTSIKRAPSSSASAITRVFPSRVLASVNNFPEIFDAPAVANDIDSFSAIDVNAADGQEITGLIPFFGDSAFGAALKSGIIVAFKEHSIYLIDLSEKDAGNNPVQRLESRGKGCTAPGSIAVTKDGIMFVHDTGIYRLNRDLTVEYIGRKYEGVFKNEFDKENIELAAGHHDAPSNKYKVSYVTPGKTSPSQVAVYDHTREYETLAVTATARQGSWTTYTNHPAIGWANLNSATFFAATSGRVFQIRRTLQNPDYRDDATAITLVVTTRANDFGDSGIRKTVRGIISHYRGQDSTGTTLKVATDMVDSFEDTDSFVLRRVNTLESAVNKVITLFSSPPTSTGVYFQLQYQNGNKDEGLELTSIDWKVAANSFKGIDEAAES